MVFRADVVTEEGAEISVTLPADCGDLEIEIMRIGAAMLSLDPVMSTVHVGLDTYKDRDVRIALEPLLRLANRTGIAVLGNAHFNKSAGNDPLSLIMGSAAFGNVVRAALGFVRDHEAEDGSCVISQIKNNLGRTDLPSLRYRIEEAALDTDEGPASVGKLVMLGDSDRSVSDILRDRDHNSRKDGADDQRDVDRWLTELLSEGPMEAKDVYQAADAAGYTKDQAKGAKKRLGVEATHPVIPGPWFWEMPQGSTQGSQGSGGSESSPLGSLGAPLDADAPEDDELCPSCAQHFERPNPNCSAAEYHGQPEEAAL
jgi:hypothetical protein